MEPLSIIEIVASGIFCACVGAFAVADVRLPRSRASTVALAIIAAIGMGALGTCAQASWGQKDAWEVQP